MDVGHRASTSGAKVAPSIRGSTRTRPTSPSRVPGTGQAVVAEGIDGEEEVAGIEAAGPGGVEVVPSTIDESCVHMCHWNRWPDPFRSAALTSRCHPRGRAVGAQGGREEHGMLRAVAAPGPDHLARGVEGAGEALVPDVAANRHAESFRARQSVGARSLQTRRANSTTSGSVESRMRAGLGEDRIGGGGLVGRAAGGIQLEFPGPLPDPTRALGPRAAGRRSSSPGDPTRLAVAAGARVIGVDLRAPAPQGVLGHEFGTRHRVVGEDVLGAAVRGCGSVLYR